MKALPISRLILALAVLAGAGAFVTWATARDPNHLTQYLPTPQQAAAEKMTIEGPPEAVRTLEDPPGSVRWTLVAYHSKIDGLCLDWVAEQVGGGENGMIGSCSGQWDLINTGPPDRVAVTEADQASSQAAPESPEPLSWLLGGVLLGGQWYNVVSGIGVDQVVKVRVTLVDGTTRLTDVVNGVWLMAFPGPDPTTDSSFDVRQIDAIDPKGDVVATAHPPSDNSAVDLYKQGAPTD